MLYYFETDRSCGLRSYPDGGTAAKEIMRELGTAGGLKFVKKATKDEISWVEAMGGKNRG